MRKVVKSILLSLIVLTSLFPIVYLLVFSIADQWFFPLIIPANFTFQHWDFVFKGGNELFNGFLLSVFISFFVSLLATISGFIASRFIVESKNEKIWLFFTYLPFVFSPVILGISVFVIFLKFNLAGTIVGILLGQLLIIFPFATLFFVGFWNNTHKQLINVAKTTGANNWQIYRLILIPISKGMLILCFFQSFLLSWFEYGLSNRIGIGKVKTLTIRVFQYINESNSTYAALACCLIIIPPTILLIINKRILFNKTI